MSDAVRFENPIDAHAIPRGTAKHRLGPGARRTKGALGQPDARGAKAKMALRRAQPCLKLCANAPIVLDQRRIAMGGEARQQLQVTGLGMRCERTDDVAIDMLPQVRQLIEGALPDLGTLAKAVVVGIVDSPLDQACQVAVQARSKSGVTQLFKQNGREPQRKATMKPR